MALWQRPLVLKRLFSNLELLVGRAWYIPQNLVDKAYQSWLPLLVLRWPTLQAFRLLCARCWLMVRLRLSWLQQALNCKNDMCLRWFLGSGLVPCASLSLKQVQIYPWCGHVLYRKVTVHSKSLLPKSISPMVSMTWQRILSILC